MPFPHSLHLLRLLWLVRTLRATQRISCHCLKLEDVSSIAGGARRSLGQPVGANTYLSIHPLPLFGLHLPLLSSSHGSHHFMHPYRAYRYQPASRSPAALHNHFVTKPETHRPPPPAPTPASRDHTPPENSTIRQTARDLTLRPLQHHLPTLRTTRPNSDTNPTWPDPWPSYSLLSCLCPDSPCSSR